jgi:predicted CXXCH cytochrome family protein
VSAPTGTLRDPDFIDPLNTSLNGTTVWWVDSEAAPNGTREKSDMLLYTRSVAGIDAGAAQPFVECASCHDPHVDNIAGNNPTFLRVSNVGSAVCLACHDK